MWCAKEVNDIVVFFQSDDPIPEGSTRLGASYWKSMVDAGYNVEYLKIEDNAVREMSDEEKIAIDNLKQEQLANQQAINLANQQAQDIINAQIEQDRLDKQIELYIFHNTFITYCDSVLNRDTHIKGSFEELTEVISMIKINDRDTAFELSNMGLMLNAKGQKLDGISWWDRCVYHEELIPTTTTTTTIII